MGKNHPESFGEKNVLQSPERVVICDDTLSEVRAKPKLREYIARLWGRRFFILEESRSKAFQRGRDMFLGKAWIVLQPLLNSAVYALVFGLLLKVDRGIDNFIGYLVLGVVFYGFATSGITGGSGLVQSSLPMMRSFNFPKASLCFSRVLRDFFDNIPPVVVGIVVALLFQIGKPPTWKIVGVVPLYLMVCVFSTGCCLVVARLTAFLPDLKALISLFVRMLFYVSGVFFSVERFATQPVLREVMILNPIYQFLTAARNMVLDGVFPTRFSLAVIGSWTGLVFLVGLVFFWSAEERYLNVK